ncbi:MAG: glutathione S-transferase N-terminal domain-containing protein, partial [Pseudomonadota bacterium]
MTDRPILWSFRRCPYAMRARLALDVSGVEIEHREILLRDKPAAFLAASPTATVPALEFDDGTSLDESFDIMLWALEQNDPEHWLPNDDTRDAVMQLIEEADGPFKHHLDRYKYATRYDGAVAEEHRTAGGEFLMKLDARLGEAPF